MKLRTYRIEFKDCGNMRVAYTAARSSKEALDEAFSVARQNGYEIFYVGRRRGGHWYDYLSKRYRVPSILEDDHVRMMTT